MILRWYSYAKDKASRSKSTKNYLLRILVDYEFILFITIILSTYKIQLASPLLTRAPILYGPYFPPQGVASICHLDDLPALWHSFKKKKKKKKNAMLVFFRKRSTLGAARARFLGRQATMLVGWGSPRSHYGPSVRDSAASGVGEGCEGRKWRERTGGDRKIWWRVAAGKGNT